MYLDTGAIYRTVGLAAGRAGIDRHSEQELASILPDLNIEIRYDDSGLQRMVLNGEDVSEDTYSCPNCGAIATIKEFQDGCKSCGTSFKMSDLFPKVSNYFFVWDVSGMAANFKVKIFKNGLYLLPFSCAMMLWMLHFRS